jgi:2-polyprenyl-3-methyl-5-hydroxy-6-metoxy-1,4-benzoquinol methylase
MTQISIEHRCDREIEHFNEHYAAEAARGITELSDFDKQRYTAPLANTIFPREYFYHLLAPLKGKMTLEIACGNGIDASICAHNGADVHAYDISTASIDMVKRRAAINGLNDKVTLQVTADIDDAFAGQTFDAILGYAALHHLPTQGIAQRIYDRLRPGGVAVFAEPVINSQALHAIRRCIPYSFWEDTDDEVPMNNASIAEFAKPFDRMVSRKFQCVSRLWPMFPNNFKLASALHRIDHVLMKLPILRRFATVDVFGLYRDR